MDPMGIQTYHDRRAGRSTTEPQQLLQALFCPFIGSCDAVAQDQNAQLLWDRRIGNGQWIEIYDLVNIPKNIKGQWIEIYPIW
jgi:hypothetical protein